MENLSKKKNDAHRYYLHRKVKQFTTISARERTVIISNSLLKSISKKQNDYLEELLNKHHYILQFTLLKIKK